MLESSTLAITAVLHASVDVGNAAMRWTAECVEHFIDCLRKRNRHVGELLDGLRANPHGKGNQDGDDRDEHGHQ